MYSQFVSRIRGVSRRGKRLILLTFDACALFLVLWIAYSLRLGTSFSPQPVQLGLMALAPVVALPVFYTLGLYRAVIRHLPERAIWTMFGAMGLAALVWLAILFLAEVTRIGVLPRSIPVLYWLLGTIVVIGSRFAAKYILSSGRTQRKDISVVIYGAGATGAMLARALHDDPSRQVVAFVDDRKDLHRREVGGIRVYAPGELTDLIADYNVNEILLSMPSVAASRQREIIDQLHRHGLKIRTLPSIADLASGRISFRQLREIDIDDLLGRSAIPADPTLLEQMVKGRSILVSGAGGSIGSELTKLVARWAPSKLVLLEANEFALYQVDRLLSNLSGVPVVAVLGSVTDDQLVRRTISENQIDVVFHAAAHKHVPLVEANVLEGVRNNVFGTATIAQASLELGVRNFVLISTDKAVRPTNVMGATKRWAEFIVQACGREAAANGQRFCAVRFGNVLGSNGSVVPLFKEQIAAGGPVTLTDERMTRFFMSIHEAAELIVQAGALSQGNDVFLLDMGDSIKIIDLARNMINLAGLKVWSETEDGDIEIKITGQRPGEKLYEELFYDMGNVDRTAHPKILRGMGGDRAIADIGPAIDELRAAMQKQDEAAVRRILFAALSEDADEDERNLAPAPL
jgi:FlaA1/EpsC-like NDP-sugar epimerase